MSNYLTITINGTDYTAYVQSVERHSSICEIENTATLNVIPQAPRFDPYQEVKIWVSGSLHFTGYVERDTLERREGGYWGRQVRCQHRGYKRLRDYWFTTKVSTGKEEGVHSFIDRVCDAADVHIDFDCDEDNELPSSYSWEYPNAFAVFEECLTFGELQPVGLPNGDVRVARLAISGSVYFNSEDLVLQCERTTEDTFFRTDVAFITAREVIWASGSNPFGYHRVAIVANPMVHEFGTGYFLGQDILSEYNRMSTSQNLTVVGNHETELGDTLRTKDRFDQETDLGIITSIDEFMRPDGGRYMEIVTNQRCPRIFGFDYTIFGVYEHVQFAIGTGAVTYGSDFLPYTPKNTAHVWVCPDITPALALVSGSCFQDGFEELEWYDCSEGLEGDFKVIYNCYGSDCLGGDDFPVGALIRDYWSEDGRGAWASTSVGLFYTPKLLPEIGQSSGSWAYTPWTLVYEYTGGDAALNRQAETKAQDSTGVYVAERRWESGPGHWWVDILQVNRTGGTETLATYPVSSYEDDYPYMGRITAPWENYKQYLSYFSFLSSPSHHITFVDECATTGEHTGSTGTIGMHGDSETDSTGDFIMASPPVATGSPGRITENPDGLTVRSTLPGALRSARDMSYDAKHERLYVVGYNPYASPPTGTFILRSDDNAYTWQIKASSGSSGWTHFPGENGVMTARILAYKIYPYIQTYCIQAVGWKRASGSYSLMVSGDDGLTFQADTHQFMGEICCMMDMATG